DECGCRRRAPETDTDEPITPEIRAAAARRADPARSSPRARGPPPAGARGVAQATGGGAGGDLGARPRRPALCRNAGGPTLARAAGRIGSDTARPIAVGGLGAGAVRGGSENRPALGADRFDPRLDRRRRRRSRPARSLGPGLVERDRWLRR